jgi:predicted ATPase/DNA-binding XRE family transcriptional regulator
MRERLTTAREDVRRRRGVMMLEAGRLLRTWRETRGVQQQDLAAVACVSATVVRRIEKGDYESPPPQSLIAAVARQHGPAHELQDLAQAFQGLQAEQKQIDKLLARKTLPDAMGVVAGADGQMALVAGLKPAVLPRPPSLFVGRRQEMSALERWLDRQRLVTVVGPGGIGKTALSLRFAGSRPPVQAGPWFADLSQVRPGEPLLPLLARLVLDDDSGGGGDGDDVAARLGAVLGRAPALVILDNCEHVLAEAAAAVARLLDECPGIRILATSREPMHLPDESVMTIGPLPVAGDEPPGSGASASQPGDAVELFMRLLSRARGEQARPSPLDADAEAEAVTDLCRQLDGIPLCIELAAARARTLPVRDIAASVGRGLAILSGGRRDLPRHQAIEATISWSWELLTRDEQRALSRLAVLAAPFTFQCGAEMASEELDSGERMVAALADKSLLSQEVTEAGGARLRVLGVVRNFAVSRLSTADRHSSVRKLMSWALTVTQVDEIALQQPEVIERLDADLPLIRAALELSEDAPADQVRLALAIWPYWHMRSSASYGCRFLAKAREEDTPLSLMERGRAFGALSNLLGYQEDFAGSIDASKRSIEIRRAIGDPVQLRYGLIGLFGSLLETRRLDEAERCLAEIDDLPGEIEPSALGDLKVGKAVLCLYRGDPRQAVQLLREAHQIFISEKMQLGQVFCLYNLSQGYRVAGDFEASLQAALKAKEIANQGFGPSFEGQLTVSVAAAYQALGRHEDALGILDATPPDEHVRPSSRTHALALRAMAASAVSPPAAASFLLLHVDKFAGQPGRGDQSIQLASAVQEIAYQSGAYETAARLLGLHGRLWRDSEENEIGPPAAESSSRLDSHLPPSTVQALIADGTRIDPGEALDFAVSVLRELAWPELASDPEDLIMTR